MYHLKVEARDTNVKAKQLRRGGMVPAVIYGRNLEQSVLVQIPQTEVNPFLRTLSKGSTLTVEVDSQKYNVLFKQVTRQPLTQNVEQIEFQHIVAGEALNSVMQVVLINRDKNQNLIQQHVEEIPYNALPKHLVQEVVIDLDGMPAGTTLRISDLEVSKNEDLKLAIPDDTVVVSVTESKRAVASAEGEDEAEVPAE